MGVREIDDEENDFGGLVPSCPRSLTLSHGGPDGRTIPPEFDPGNEIRRGGIRTTTLTDVSYEQGIASPWWRALGILAGGLGPA
jgi:hypothetical protein